MNVDDAMDEELYPFVTGDLYLLSGCDCSDHSGYIASDVLQAEAPGFTCLYLRLNIHHCYSSVHRTPVRTIQM